MRALPLLAASIFLTSCASYPQDASLVELLPDCTEEFGGWAGKPATGMPGTERARILNAATQWAKSREYFPCNVTVCGAIIDANARSVSVFLTGYGDLNPSATAKFSRKGFRLLDEIIPGARLGSMAQRSAAPNNSFKGMPLHGTP